MRIFMFTIFIAFNVNAQVSIYPKKDSLIHNFEAYYSNCNSDKRKQFEKKMDQVCFFDDVKSVQSLIDLFGPDFFLKDEVGFRAEITDYINDNYSWRNYDTNNLINRISTLKVKLENKININDLSPFLWDGLLRYYTYSGNSKWTGFSEHPELSIISSFNIEYDDAKNRNFIPEMEEIQKAIDSIPHPQLKYQAYIMFLKNLFVSEMYSELFSNSQRMLKLLLEEPGSKIIFQPRKFDLVNFEENIYSTPFKKTILITKHQKVSSLIEVLKLLTTSRQEDVTSNKYVSLYFGAIRGLMEDDSLFIDERDLINEMEIEYFNSIGRIQFNETAYYNMSFNLLNGQKFQNRDLTQSDYVKYNNYLIGMSLNWWQWNKVNMATYPDLKKKQVAQFILQGLIAIDDHKEGTTPSAIRNKGLLYLQIAVYMDLNGFFEEAHRFSMQYFNLIESYPELFCSEDLSELLLCVAMIHKKMTTIDLPSK